MHKKTPRVSIHQSLPKLYPERYFLLTSTTLTYYTRRTDLSPKGVVDLTSVDVLPLVNVKGGGESTRFRKDRRRLFKVNEVEVVGKGVEPVGERTGDDVKRRQFI